MQKKEKIEDNFLKLFSNVTYDENEDDLVKSVLEVEKSVENRYDIKAHIPKINLETCTSINDEIVEIFGGKILSVLDNEQEYTRYSLDYVYSVNDTIISLVIKATLKEGNNPQRSIIKTYNYDVSTSSEIELSSILESKNLNKEEIQKQIMNTVSLKNTDAQTLSSQGYNIFVRDLNSDEYKIENVENYYIDKNGQIYIIFAYGNNNFTETIDVIKL